MTTREDSRNSRQTYRDVVAVVLEPRVVAVVLWREGPVGIHHLRARGRGQRGAE